MLHHWVCVEPVCKCEPSGWRNKPLGDRSPPRANARGVRLAAGWALNHCVGLNHWMGRSAIGLVMSQWVGAETSR